MSMLPALDTANGLLAQDPRATAPHCRTNASPRNRGNSTTDGSLYPESALYADRSGAGFGLPGLAVASRLVSLRARKPHAFSMLGVSAFGGAAFRPSDDSTSEYGSWRAAGLRAPWQHGLPQTLMRLSRVGEDSYAVAEIARWISEIFSCTGVSDAWADEGTVLTDV